MAKAKSRAKIRSNKDAALVHKRIGNEFYLRRKFKEALEEYDKAIALDKTNMTFFSNKAAVHFELGDYLGCVILCARAVHTGRDNNADSYFIAKALSRMGAAYLKMDRFFEAKVAYGNSLMTRFSFETLFRTQAIEEALERSIDELPYNRMILSKRCSFGCGYDVYPFTCKEIMDKGPLGGWDWVNVCLDEMGFRERFKDRKTNKFNHAKWLFVHSAD